MRQCHSHLTPFSGPASTYHLTTKELIKWTSSAPSNLNFGVGAGELNELQDEIGAWSIDVTSTQRGVKWQMKIDDARCKLLAVYPKIQV